MIRIKRVLISVSDKTNLLKLAKTLKRFRVEMISTGGTRKLLRENGISSKSVTDVTGFPEILDGRVKTLHPNVYGGILARRDQGKHMDELDKHKITPIDLIVVN